MAHYTDGGWAPSPASKTVGSHLSKFTFWGEGVASKVLLSSSGCLQAVVLLQQSARVAGYRHHTQYRVHIELDQGTAALSNELQEKAAKLLGVEQTLFVPTNTMANLISALPPGCCWCPELPVMGASTPERSPAGSVLQWATALWRSDAVLARSIHVMGHCRRRGSQVLLGQECHLHVYEQGGVAQIAGVHSQPLPDMPHGTLDLNELERALTRGFRNSYHPVCELVCLENTHSSAGGRVLPIDYLRQVRLLAHTYGARVHLDGARLMNAAVALRVPPARLVEHCDSVSFCFSKGLGAPVGALVGGAKGFIEEAWRLRKALGGGMRQAGVLAAAAMVGLAEAEEVLPRDHENARRFAKGAWTSAHPTPLRSLLSGPTCPQQQN
ncbi:hypothetical protein U0070_013894 [Myodes glareolus]|uniref:Aromatic amino acid beta-eliminating lyase/threonine aldolase domain-containing protein n=1 Tax=Myodes glareolus TaxID=447135 RepID=A0AAW0HZQ9_MYOGA